MVKEKINNELINKLSPVLKFMQLSVINVKGVPTPMIKVNTGKDSVEVKFFNGSSITVLPPVESSRGSRACVTIYDECRLLKKQDVDDIFVPMKRPRPAHYLTNNVKYSTNPIYREEPQEIYITSAKYKNEWFFRTFKRTVESCFTKKKMRDNFFGGDIYLALQYGLKSWNDWANIQKSANELSLRMEYLNEMIGEIEDAYFPLEVFKYNQVLTKPFNPPTIEDIVDHRDLGNAEKKPNETRILAIDFAFANSVKGKQEADNTVIECISGFYRKGKITRHLDYIETLGGGESTTTKMRIRELFFDYKADYIIMDLRSGGEIVFNDLTAPLKHPSRPSRSWNEHGFTVCSDSSLQLLSKPKLDDLRQRTIDPEAIPCIIPIQATSENNSIFWQSLKQQLQDGTLKLLLDDMDMENEIETHPKKYKHLTRNERTKFLLPFVQTALTVHEGIELKQEWREGKLKLSEPYNATKDRMVTLAYGNYIFDKIETKQAKNDQSSDNTDWSCIMSSW